MQTKPGSMVTWILVAASLISLFGGGLGSVALFLLWFVTRGASSISSARSHLGTAGIREEKADVAKELSDDDDPASPEDVQGSKASLSLHVMYACDAVCAQQVLLCRDGG